MTASASIDPQIARRHDLDWLRIGAFGLLILYHIGMFYVPWDWHVKSAHAGDDLRPWMVFTNPWRLTLLFVISGTATRFLADKMATGAMASSRSTRLLLPLAFGMLVVVPPQTYYEVVEKAAFVRGFAEFYVLYIQGYVGWLPGGPRLIVPTWNHLWFVAYLWVYTMLILLLRPAWPVLGAWLERAMPGIGVLTWPALIAASARLMLHPQFGATHALVDDWYLHAIYFPAFFFGFLAAKSAPIWAALVRWRWFALALFLGAYVLIAWPQATLPAGVQGTEAGRRILRLAYGIDQWAAIVALLGFARLWLDHDGPARRYLTEAIFPYYILHQTLIVVAGHHLSAARLSAPLEATALIVLTASGCALGYEIIRRIAWLRPLFGLKSVQPSHFVNPALTKSSSARSG
ncbi:MAG: acyltransferase [Alphaproteobacteria bacterium]|nr:acyltransferase [Alphaproteobacteria bacterium]